MIYLFTPTGPLDANLVVGDSLTQMYGDDVLDLRKPWATHASVLAQLINSQGNSMMIQRLLPADAGPKASIRLSLDLLPTQIDDYTRNADGSIKTDVNGTPVVAGQIAGFKAKWVVEAIPMLAGVHQIGLGTQGPGNQADGGNQSVRYPILDIAASHFGSAGNNFGVRLWAPTINTAQTIDQRILANEKVYPFRMQVVKRLDSLSTAKAVETMSGEQNIQVSWQRDVIDRNTEKELSIHNVFLQSYQQLDNPNFPPVYGPFGDIHVYDNQIAAVQALVYAKEKLHADGFSDIDGSTAGEVTKLNLISGQSSQGVPYHAYSLVTGAADSVRLNEASTVWAMGASDGTMDEASFAPLVSTAIGDFADENSVMQDRARYPVSIFYDSGFPLDTKKALAQFIAMRKDTALVLGTHDVLGNALTSSEESALAVALRTRVQNFPESEYFGTSTMRAIIVGRSGMLIGSQYRKRLPLTLDLAHKAAAYMGAGNGKWKNGLSFSRAPASEVTMFQDINVTFTPAKVRNQDWANGLNWVESFGRRSVYFPALKTVYDNDTSVLNSFFTMMACVELQKVGDRARRQFSGSDDLTDGQLIEGVNEYIEKAVEGKFDGRYIIRPNTYFTQADTARGFSWTTAIKLYSPNMKTVGTLSVEAYRIEDAAQ